MPLKDYLLREIEKMGLFLRLIIEKLLGKQPSMDLVRELQQMNGLFMEHWGFDMDYLSGAAPEELIRSVTALPGFDSANIEQLADFMAMLANTMDISDISKSRQLRSNALALYQHIEIKDKTFSIERHDKMNALEAKIR